MLMSPLIRLPNAKPPKKHKEGITLLSPLNEKCFFLPLSLNFINVLIVSQKFCIVLEAFVSFVECGIFQWNRRIFSKLVEYPWPKLKKKKQQQTNKQKQKNIKNAWKRYFFLIACNLRLFVHSSSSPKKKVLKGVVNYQQTRVTILAINLISTFCTQFQLFALKTFIFLHCSGLIDALSANERAEIFASILLKKKEIEIKQNATTGNDV